MRTAKTHVRLHGSDKFALLHGPDKPLREQYAEFKTKRGRVADDKVAEVHYQESDGPLRVARFLSPELKKAEDERKAKLEAEEKRKAEEQKKAEAKAKEASPKAQK